MSYTTNMGLGKEVQIKLIYIVFKNIHPLFGKTKTWLAGKRWKNTVKQKVDNIWT